YYRAGTGGALSAAGSAGGGTGRLAEFYGNAANRPAAVINWPGVMTSGRPKPPELNQPLSPDQYSAPDTAVSPAGSASYAPVRRNGWPANPAVTTGRSCPAATPAASWP